MATPVKAALKAAFHLGMIYLLKIIFTKSSHHSIEIFTDNPSKEEVKSNQIYNT